MAKFGPGQLLGDRYWEKKGHVRWFQRQISLPNEFKSAERRGKQESGLFGWWWLFGERFVSYAGARVGGVVQTCHLMLVTACNASKKCQIWQEGFRGTWIRHPFMLHLQPADPPTVVVAPKPVLPTIFCAKYPLVMRWLYARLLTGRSSLATVSPVLKPSAGYY